MNDSDISVTALVASEAFQRFCLNPTPEDKAHWEAWMKEEAGRPEMVDEAKCLILDLSEMPSSEDVKLEWNRLKAELPGWEQPVAKTRNLWSRKTWIGVAASVAAAVWLGVLLWNPSADFQWQEYATSFGETRLIELPDGTEITLNAKSSLRFDAALTQADTREVWLEGEGFFDVAHDPKHPFILHTSEGDVRVLGTSFNVFQRATQLQVTLVEGKVQLTLPDQSDFLMAPGDQVAVRDGQADQRQVETDFFTAWKTGQLVFKEVAIRDLIDRLAWEFDLKVSVERADVLNQRVNAVIPNPDPDALLKAIGEIYDLDIVQQAENTYLIR
ncbi:FecR domain-containing protein [Pontibacter sp. G13]|uniref:FecR family protein n=1 Tax=Pontibacter sp. G13 TaxID=3074898 RepID=UPI002889A870|nr:FecR domain-containing protein [Pontibacter sp. G13]WNJ19696.1 FecR domain-containing protein [Pontibacter sp. G13]